MRIVGGLTAVTLLSALSGVAANAQNLLADLARSELRLGQAYLNVKDYEMALIKFEQVWDMDDPDHEISETRAIAGFHICLTYALTNRIEPAKEACQKVLRMPDAPQRVKADARSVFERLQGAGR